jgi:hypothetical protein
MLDLDSITFRFTSVVLFQNYFFAVTCLRFRWLERERERERESDVASDFSSSAMHESICFRVVMLDRMNRLAHLTPDIGDIQWLTLQNLRLTTERSERNETMIVMYSSSQIAETGTVSRNKTVACIVRRRRTDTRKGSV